MATIGYILSFLIVTGVVLIFMYVVRLARQRPTSTPTDRRVATTWIVTGAAIALGAGLAAVVLFALGMLWKGPFTALGLGAVVVAVAGLTVSYSTLMRHRPRSADRRGPD